MKRALSFLVVVVAFLTLGLAGCGPKWTVVKQASPNPMSAKSNFKVDKAVFDPSFRVGSKTEQEWMADKKDESKKNWDGDKVAMTEKFTDGFMAGKDNILITNAPGAGIFSVRAKYLQYDPGYYIGISSAPTTLEAEVDFLDAGGGVVDTIRIHVKQSGFSSGEGARRCAEQVGSISAKYLKERLGM